MKKHPRRPEAGALTIGWCLLAIATAPAAPSPGYLPATGPAPLRFQPPKPAGLPAGLQLLLQPDNRGTDLTNGTTNSPAMDAMDPWVFPPPDTAASSAPARPPDTADSPIPAQPPNPFQLALPPSSDAALATNPMIDMRSLLSWLLPNATNAPVSSVLFPVFVPATPPPRPSQAVYESK